MKLLSKFGDVSMADIKRTTSGLGGIHVGGVFEFECYDKDGNLKWRDTAKNLVVNVGLQHILDVVFSGTTQVTTWYVALLSSTPTIAAADTMASHAGWTTVTTYSDANDPAWVEVRSGQSMTNSASKAVFNINGTVTVGGAYLHDNNTKGAATGTLMCAAAFTGGNRSVVDTDVLNVTYTFSAADDGV